MSRCSSCAAAAASATTLPSRSRARTPALRRARCLTSSSTLSLRINVIGRYAREAAAQGTGEVRAVFRRSCYVAFAGERYACVGDASLGRGPLNALAAHFVLPAIGDRLALESEAAELWVPAPLPPVSMPDVRALQRAARGQVPREGLGCLVLDAHNSLSGHAEPALEAIERWLIGNALEDQAQTLIGLGRGLPPSCGASFGGVLLALRQLGREAQAPALWRCLEPRLKRTSAISAA